MPKEASFYWLTSGARDLRPPGLGEGVHKEVSFHWLNSWPSTSGFQGLEDEVCDKVSIP